MALEKIKGQDRARKILESHLEKGHYHHAYLFHGPGGVGKRTAAREFAGAIFCEEEGTEACGKCRPCSQFAGGNHPDYQEIEAGDRTMGIDIIRELRRSLTLKPYQGRYRIFLISRVEKMTTQAANSFLKSLEEPPPYVIFILTTDNRELLLPTINSRAFPITFNFLGKKFIESYLEKIVADPQKRRIIGGIAGGSLGVACQLLEGDHFLEQRKELISRWSKMGKQSFLEVHDLVQWLEKEWEGDYYLFFQLLQYWLRDLFYWKHGQQENLLHQDCVEYLEEEGDRWKTEDLEKALITLDQLQREKDRKINWRLALEATLLQINSWRQ